MLVLVIVVVSKARNTDSFRLSSFMVDWVNSHIFLSALGRGGAINVMDVIGD